MRAGRLLIGGEWREARAGRTYEKRNPWRPDEVVGIHAAAAAEDAADAVSAAQEALPAWARLPAAERAAIFTRAAAALEARAEDVAREMTRRDGQAAARGARRVARAAAIMRYAAGEAWRPAGEVYEASVPDQLLYTRRRPVGVVGLITPWNFPAAIPVWKLAPALAYGNTVVLKLGLRGACARGSTSPSASAEAGLPAGVLNVLTGSGSEAGAELVRNPGVRAISFTGSVPVGSRRA